MNNTRIGVTLYTLRDFVKTPPDIAVTLKRVREMGYRNIQLSALGPIDARELAAMIHDQGLHVCATHVGFDRLETALDTVLEEHRLWGCVNIAVGSMPASYRTSDGYRRFAHDASVVAKNIHAAGMTFSYHNHHWELERADGGRGLDILIRESDPALGFEIDTYWIQYGGGDPAAWIRKVRGRCPIIHFKDMAVANRQPVMAEVGEGNLNWPAIVDACRTSEARWFVVEQDTCAGDPFDSIAVSLRNMQAMEL
ncbi:MAG: sugar phosphate isomerase/epimerase [candidate division Zixibacteria bacterium]|nr:sugar phosphate isomerase/epimerase [candidate division Zixibacteria bacterium]